MFMLVHKSIAIMLVIPVTSYAGLFSALLSFVFVFYSNELAEISLFSPPEKCMHSLHHDLFSDRRIFQLFPEA